jgi:hypothetical protein
VSIPWQGRHHSTCLTIALEDLLEIFTFDRFVVEQSRRKCIQHIAMSRQN